MPLLLPNKTYTIPSTGHTYAYIRYPSSNILRPTLLFLHGFPSTSYDWRFQIPHFRSLGYGILAPDLLGYGGTSRPTDVRCYLGSEMSKEIIAILDHERLGSKEETGSGAVVAIAHDWGTYLLSQLASRYQERFEKFVFMSVPFTIPGRRTDVEMVNRRTKKKFGYDMMGYFLFLSTPRAGRVLGENVRFPHLISVFVFQIDFPRRAIVKSGRTSYLWDILQWETFFNLTHPADPALWKTYFAPEGAMETFVTTNPPSISSSLLASYITEEDKAHHHAVFGSDYGTPCLWYVRGVNSLGVEEEKASIKTGNVLEKIGKETLMIATINDAVCSPERARIGMQAGVEGGLTGENLAFVNVESGHWVMLECADQTNRILEEFFEEGAKAFDKGGIKSSL